MLAPSRAAAVRANPARIAGQDFAAVVRGGAMPSLIRARHLGSGRGGRDVYSHVAGQRRQNQRDQQAAPEEFRHGHGIV